MNQNDIEDIYPLSPMQEGLLFQSLYDTYSKAYFIQMGFWIKGKFDFSLFKKTLNTICQRHQIFRTVFMHQGVKKPLQVVLKNGISQIKFLDISNISEQNQQKEIERYQNKDIQDTYDFEKHPPTKIAVFRCSDHIHYILWSYHHILIDGWCIKTIEKEFLDIYTSLSKGADPILSQPAKYSDYIRWIEKQDKEKAIKYWKDYIEGFEQVTSLPKLAVKTDSNTGIDNEGYLKLELDQKLTGLINDRAREYGVTLNTVIKSVWAIVLSRYCDKNDVLFGSIVSGRPPDLDRVEEIVGLFINALPVRVKIEPESSFAELVQNVQESFIQSERYNYISLADIKSLSNSVKELFDIMYVFENYPSQSDSKRDKELDFTISSDHSHDRTHYGFSLIVGAGDTVRLHLKYDNSLYSQKQIERLKMHIKTTIIEIADNFNKKVKDIYILTEEEKHFLAYKFNDTKALYPKDCSIVDLFEEQVKKTPQNTAVIFKDKKINYSTLNKMSETVRCYLIKDTGIKKGDFCAVIMGRSHPIIYTFIGVLKAGCAYIPIDPAYPEDRIKFMLKDSKAAVILTDNDNLELVFRCAENKNSGLKIVNIEALEKDDKKSSEKKEKLSNFKAAPDDTAYVIYTSGSTGIPKGCMVTHQNVVRLMKNSRFMFDFGPKDVWSCAHSFCFDFSVWEMYGALFYGGSIAIAQKDQIADTDKFLEFIIKNKITVLNQTPQAFFSLPMFSQDSKEFKNLCLEDHLRYVIFGGDRLEPAYLKPWIKLYSLDKITLINMYGITETTVHVTFCRILEKDVTASKGLSPIGIPLPETRVYIFDSDMRLMPQGAAGQMYVAGTGVSKGYLNRDELTGQRFIEDPFCNSIYPGQKMYKTGDIGRLKDDCTLEHLGRIDDQIQLRGYRVEPGEIENRLSQHPDIDKAVVIPIDGQHGVQQLAAYIVCPVSTPSVEELSGHIKERLPQYMVPSFFVPIKEIPLTSNKKVDRKALPDPLNSSISPKGKYLAPRDDLETKLVSIWKQVIQKENIGVDDNFFEIGGHSLKAMQVVSRIFKIFNVKITLQEIFSNPTISALSTIVKKAEPKKFLEILPAPKRELYNLSHEQKRLWVIYKMGQGSAYNIPSAYVSEKDIDIDILRKAYQALIKRHESLRTAFVESDGEPMQKIYDTVDFDIKEIDISKEENPIDTAKKIVSKEAASEFDLTKPPLLRASIIKLDDNRYVFCMNMPHIITDGWSMVILQKELEILYNAFSNGMANPLTPLKIQYKDFTEFSLSRDFKKEEEYWLKKFSIIPEPIKLPYDFALLENRNSSGEMKKIEIEQETFFGLKQLAERKNTTLSCVMLAVFNLFLYKISGQEDFCVGIGTANRNHPETENIIGFFVNILPILANLSSNMEFEEMVDQVIKNYMEALENQDYPFDLLIQKLNPKRYGISKSIFNVFYGFQNLDDLSISETKKIDTAKKDGNMTNFDFSSRKSRMDLTLSVAVGQNTLILYMEYDTALFKPQTIEKYLIAIKSFCQTIAKNEAKEQV